jgi:hypothetical protein
MPRSEEDESFALNVGGHPAERVQTLRYLGVLLDKRLTFKERIAAMLGVYESRMALLHTICLPGLAGARRAGTRAVYLACVRALNFSPVGGFPVGK